MGTNPLFEMLPLLLTLSSINTKTNFRPGNIVAGVDDVDGASIYEVTLGGSMLKQDVCLGGSGSTYIYGYVDSNYNPNMTPEEGEEFVRRGTDL